MHAMHSRRYHSGQDRLREPERVRAMEPGRVAALSLAGLTGHAHSILDLGTGTGLFAEAFAPRATSVTGLDVNMAMLRAARTYLPGARYHQATIEHLPYANNAFDVVFMGLAFHEADDRGLALFEACRVARRRVVVLESPHPEDTPCLPEHGPPLSHRLSVGQISALAHQVGCGEPEVYTLSSLVLYLFTLT